LEKNSKTKHNKQQKEGKETAARANIIMYRQKR
jgi:hypothetical protein